ncbi:unnamed protein product [Malus baccata var. baccata]
MPAFPTFTGEESSVSSKDHIFKFSNHCVAYEDNPNYKLRLFGNSLAGLASQWALRLPLRKRFYNTQFNELHELVIAATKYERLLLEEQQVKHTSKAHPFYKNKAAIHHVEVGEIRPEHEGGHDREEVEVCAAEMTTPFKPLMVKGLVQPLKDQKIVMNDEGFVPMKPPKYQSYSFDLAKAPEIYEELFREWIQDLIVKGKMLLDKPQASMMVDTNPFPEAPINTINLIWVGKPGSSVVTTEERDGSQVVPALSLK